MQATLKPIKPGLTDEALTAAAQQLGRGLPEPLRRLLKEADGAYVDPEWVVVEWPTPEGDVPELVQLHYLYDVDTLIKESRALAQRLPQGALAIGQDPGGALLLLLTEGEDAGAIRFWRMAYDPYGEGDNTAGLGLVAASLDEMLASMEPEPSFE